MKFKHIKTQILSGFTSLNGFKNIRNQIDEVIKNLLDETKEDCDEDCQMKLKKIVQRSLQGVSQILEPLGFVGILQNLCFYNIFFFKTGDINPQKVRTDTKAMLEECTYNNGCISGVDCEGCAVEVIIVVISVIIMMMMTLLW